MRPYSATPFICLLISVVFFLFIDVSSEKISRRPDSLFSPFSPRKPAAAPTLPTAPARAFSPPPLDPSLPLQLRLELEPGSALVHFSIGSDTTILTLIRHGEKPLQKTLEIGEKEIQRCVENFRRQIIAAANGAHLSTPHPWFHWRGAARSLYDRLLGPIDKDLESSDRLLLVPDGSLHLLPWGALIREGARGQRASLFPQLLVQWKPFSIWSSKTLLADLRRLRGSEPAPAPTLAAFGAPNFDLAETESSWPAEPNMRSISIPRSLVSRRPLPASRIEVENIASAFPGRAKIFLGEQATEAAVREVAPKAKFLHFATHSFFDPRHCAMLALTPPTYIRSERDNGYLMDREILRDLRLDAELVVLSSCESGRGPEVAGGDKLGLARAFQEAGARSVVASLWPVDDLATAIFMPSFYRFLAAGLPKDRALQAAQLTLIGTESTASQSCKAQGSLDLFLPIFWAAFQLYGDWE